MNKTIQSLVALAAFGALTITAQAQTPIIRIVDMAKLYDGHYKTEEQNTKLKGDGQKAQDELEKLNKEGNDLVEQYKELVDQSNNPAATVEAKAKAQADSQKKLEEIQRKQNEVRSFESNTQRSLQQRVKTFRDLMLEEIGKIATDIAKRKGATLLLDKSGPTLIGVSPVIYSDAGLDITDEVMKEINKDRPVSVATPAATAPAATAPKAADDTPKITVPGVTPKK